MMSKVMVVSDGAHHCDTDHLQQHGGVHLSLEY